VRSRKYFHEHVKFRWSRKVEQRSEELECARQQLFFAVPLGRRDVAGIDGNDLAPIALRKGGEGIELFREVNIPPMY
jgi:hypothetical protein